MLRIRTDIIRFILIFKNIIKLVVGKGYDPFRSSPSDRSPEFISLRRTPVLPTIKKQDTFKSALPTELP